MMTPDPTRPASTPTAPTRTAPRGPQTRTPLWLRLLTWLADRDAAYRQRRRLAEMPRHLLDDIGLDRNAAFYRGPARRKADAVPPVVLTAARLQ